eukprot:CAMPEP_0115764192 /NCGR_PEP_ID=MMETSP0272-20121206/101933_1 /TAXON_ID=71861 /ORGANISM="Scrippsiella trochoidea, Strain CCMP3099" /LENGTH=178 /DNA_ID=CAMNT_0003209971 /DNA_START=27 /DNA_END=564 /DNA_ORIENTATION=+
MSVASEDARLYNWTQASHSSNSRGSRQEQIALDEIGHVQLISVPKCQRSERVNDRNEIHPRPRVFAIKGKPPAQRSDEFYEVADREYQVEQLKVWDGDRIIVQEYRVGGQRLFNKQTGRIHVEDSSDLGERLNVALYAVNSIAMLDMLSSKKLSSQNSSDVSVADLDIPMQRPKDSFL